jgi:hypothetical protein
LNRPLAAPIVLAILLAAALPLRAQLDLGSHGIPQDSIDAYIEPFHRLVAAGLGSDRHVPSAGGFGWHAGVQAAAVPVPDGRPFEDVDLSVLPMFRLVAGVQGAGFGAMARGLAWSDGGIGTLSTFGGALSAGGTVAGFSIPGAGTPVSVKAGWAAGWDRLDFSSEYTYRYRGTVLGLFGQDIPGDYTLTEILTGTGPRAALEMGPWRIGLDASYERAWGSFRYLYLDPRGDRPSRVSSRSRRHGLRVAGEFGWRGFRAQAGWAGNPHFSAGWSFSR